MVTTHNSTALRTNGRTDYIFNFNLFWVKAFLASVHQTRKRPIFISTMFLFLFSHPRRHTNPSTLMDAKQWIKTFLLLRLFKPTGPFNHRTTRYVHHHCNTHCYHAIFLFVDLLQTSLENILTIIDIF